MELLPQQASGSRVEEQEGEASDNERTTKARRITTVREIESARRMTGRRIMTARRRTTTRISPISSYIWSAHQRLLFH